MIHKRRKPDARECLIFPRFIPQTGPDKDLRGLVELVRSIRAYMKESEGSTFSFVRGSSVSSWDGALVQAHSHSDIDIMVVDGGRNHLSKSRQPMQGRRGEIDMCIDIRHINQKMLDDECVGRGRKGIGGMMNLTHDSLPLTNSGTYMHYRKLALWTFLRIGLKHFDSPSTMTPSGAMAVVNQGRLLINPLRWWSIQYAFIDSTTAPQNIARYHQDVERMMYENFSRSGRSGEEDVYRVPNGLALGALEVFRSSIGFFMGRIWEKLCSRPIFPPEERTKMKNKLKSLVRGIFEGKRDIYSIFREPAAIAEQPGSDPAASKAS